MFQCSVSRVTVFRESCFGVLRVVFRCSASLVFCESCFGVLRVVFRCSASRVSVSASRVSMFCESCFGVLCFGVL